MNLKRFLSIIFVVAFSVSFAMVIFGEAGLRTAFQKSQSKVQLEAKIAGLRAENEQLKEKIRSIKENRYDLEYYVRKVANLAAEDELIFEFE